MKTREDMAALGFTGFTTVWALRDSGLAEVPMLPGVYALVCAQRGDPVFEAVSSGGHFKGKDPTVPVAELAAKWVPDSQIVYIGKAGGEDSRATLRSRLKQYLDFGAGKNIGHWGGRYVWQLRSSKELLVSWRPAHDSDPEMLEGELLRAFVALHGRLPFANLKAGRG